MSCRRSGRMAAAAEPRRPALDCFRLHDTGTAGIAAGIRCDPAAPCRHQARQPPAGVAQGCRARGLPVSAAAHFHGASGVVDDRCDRSHAVSPVPEPAQSAAVGHRRSGEPQPAAAPRQCLWPHERRRGARRRCFRPDQRLATGGLARGRAVPRALDCIARHRSVDQPRPAGGESPGGDCGGRQCAATGRAPYLALL